MSKKMISASNKIMAIVDLEFNHLIENYLIDNN